MKEKWPHFGDLPVRKRFSSGILRSPSPFLSRALAWAPGLSLKFLRTNWVRPAADAAKSLAVLIHRHGGCDYRGEVKVILINLGTETFVINDQERIAQMVLPGASGAHGWTEELSDTAAAPVACSTGVQ